MNLVQNHNHYTTAKAIYSVVQEREFEGMLRPETALYRAPTFSLLLVSQELVILVHIMCTCNMHIT